MAVIDITTDVGSPDAALNELAIDQVVMSAAPRPLLSRTAEARLGARHREVLERLDELFMENGFSSFTIADLAREVGCSRRTLYELAPSKGQLVLIVLDRRLHRMGRAALSSIDPTTTMSSQLRQYINGAIGYEMFAPMIEDLADDGPARRLVDRHYRFSMTVVQRIIAIGVERGEFAPVDPAVVAAVVTSSSRYFSQSDVVCDTGRSLAELVGGMLDLVLAGLPVAR